MGIIGGSTIAFLNPIDSAPPPTPAWTTIIINSNATYSSTGDTNITALFYKDELFLLSDGSIGFNITTYP